MMRCLEPRENLSAYFDGELEEPRRAQLAAHLAECPTCQRYLDDLSRVSRLVRTDQDSHPPDGLWERIHSAALVTKAGRTLRIRGWAVPAASIAAGFVLYMAGYGGLLLWQQTSGEPRLAERNQIREVLLDAAVSLTGEALAEPRLAWLNQRPENRVLEALLAER